VSDRSDELRRQRDLLREHLDWLEREISQADAEPAQDAPVARQPPPRIIAPVFSITASDADRDAEAILAQYRRPAPAVESQTKRGCILYFAVALALFLAVAAAFFFFYYKSRR
jgi:hypothetical protein